MNWLTRVRLALTPTYLAPLDRARLSFGQRLIAALARRGTR